MGYVNYKNRLKSSFLTVRIISSRCKRNLLSNGFTYISTIAKASKKPSESIFLKLVNQIGLPKIRKYLEPPNI
jgi:hypothetical protein